MLKPSQSLPILGALLLAAGLLVAEHHEGAGGSLPDVSAEAIESHLRFLADDALEGRNTGTAGFDVAASYVASRFKSFGLEPAGTDGTWYQAVPLVEDTIDPASAVVQIHADGETIDLEWKEDFLMGGDPTRPSNEVKAPVVFVGHGISAPELGYDDYAGVDVEGKVVLRFGGAPAHFPHNERAYYSSSRTKNQIAVARGAVGVLGLRSRQDMERRPWERSMKWAGRPDLSWVTEDGRASGHFPELQAGASLSPDAAGRLFAAAGLSVDEILDAQAEGVVESRELPIEVTMRRSTHHRELSSNNVAGVLRGSDPDLRDEYVIYTAHLDHVGLGPEKDGDHIYNGAYDNAMGVAILLETARAFAEQATPPRRSILFLAVTGEEKGLLGSDFFATNPTVPIESIVANVNLDMPLFLYPLADVIPFGSEHSSLAGSVERAAAATGFDVTEDPMPEEVLFIRSDQYSLVRQGVPAVFLVSGMRSSDPEIDARELWLGFLKNYYHSPQDDLTREIHYPSAVRFTQANLLIGLEIANETERPTWNEGDFFGERFGRQITVARPDRG